MDLAIVDALVYTMTGDGLGPIEDGAVGVEDGELRYVGPADGLDPEDAATVVDGDGHVLVPGFVNGHAHTGLTLLRGGAQDVPEIEWMNRALAPLARQLEPADEVAGARLGVLEAARSGVTTVGEYAANVGALVESVYRPLGVRVVATETINEIATDRDDLGPRELPAFDRERGAAALERTERLFDRYEGDGLVTPMYGPQALDMVSEGTFEAVLDRVDRHGRDLHVHVAQGERERLQVAERYGASTVETLDAMGACTERLLAAHLHDASAAERAMLAERGVRMAACPSSIAAIDGIVPPAAEYVEAGGHVTVGTDQAPGPGGHDFGRELRTAALLSKVDRADPRAMPAWRSLRLGTIEGARALGIDDRVGSLEVGKRADLAVFDLGEPGLVPSVSEPLRTAAPNLVYGGAGAAHVLVDGEFVVRDGEFVGADAEAIVDRAQHRAERAFRAGAGEWREAGSALVDDVAERRL